MKKILKISPKTGKTKKNQNKNLKHSVSSYCCSREQKLKVEREQKKKEITYRQRQ